jgi:mannose-6-phosphate isomerase-like protein (cupin superfamily)
LAATGAAVIVNISRSEYEAMPATFSGDWLRDEFPDVAASMDRFIDKVKSETHGEIVGDLAITRIPLDVYGARNFTSRMWHASCRRDGLASTPVFLLDDAAIGSPYFQSISLGLECAFLVAAGLHADDDDQAQQGRSRDGRRPVCPAGEAARVLGGFGYQGEEGGRSVRPICDARGSAVGAIICRSAAAATTDVPAPPNGAAFTVMTVIPIEQLRRSAMSALFEGGDEAPISFFVTEFPQGRGPDLHAHPYPEVLLVETGAALFTVGEEQFTVTGQHVVVVPAHTPHGFKGAADDTLRVTSMHASPTVVQTDL